jgi:hypothetical protein
MGSVQRPKDGDWCTRLNCLSDGDGDGRVFDRTDP